MAIGGIIRGSGGHFQKHVPLPRPPATVAGSPPGSRTAVCRFWLQGRCTRAPCPFLHSRGQTPPAPPTHHPPTQQQQQHQWRRRPSLPSLVWRNPNAAPVPGNSPKPRGDGDKKRPIITRDEDAPPSTRPRRDDGRRGTTIAAGEDAPEPEFLLDPAAAAALPTCDGDDEFDERGTTVTVVGGHAPEPEFLLPSPAAAGACPSCDGDGESDERGTIVGEDAPEPKEFLLPPAAPARPTCDGDDESHERGTIVGEDAPEPEFLLSPPAAARPTRDGDDEFDERSTIATVGEDAPAELDFGLPPPSTDDEGVGEKRSGITTVAGEEADAHKDGALGGGIGCGSSFSFIASLGGHQQPVTGIALPPCSDKLFTGSADGAVRIWDCGSGRCAGVFDFCGPISCVITDGHWVFAGGRGGVRGCNALTGAGLTLPGTTAQVWSLDTSTDMVFAGMADGSILAWKVTLDAADPAGLCFRPAASLWGHTSAVVSLCVGCVCTRLYSGSADGTIRAWDAKTLRCVYTVSSAHDDAVTSLLCWRDYLLSSSLDGTVKAWAAVAKEGDEDNDAGDGGGLTEVYARQEGQGVRLLNGVYDGEGGHVLMCSLAADGAVRLYDLPSFADRGSIACGGQVGAMHTAPHGGFFFTGDATGEVSVWRWS